MSESEIRRLIRQEIREELAPILMGLIVSNQSQGRVTVQRFSTEGEVQGLRSISPYGVASKAPAGTACTVIPVRGDPTHLLQVGHFDPNQPTLNDGESVLYGADGQVIYMKSGGTIHQGTQSAASPVVLGDVLKTLMDSVLSAFVNNESQVAYDGLGLPCVLNPTITSTLTNDKSQYVDTASTNFLGQKNFVDRGA